MQGKLYLCATPIGNLQDMTLRAIDTLRQVDLIAAEDTRNSIKILNHFEIKTPMTSYHEYNKIDKAYFLVKEMKEGKNIALITDAGMPAISDPGEDLVRICHEEGVEVTVVPGASAVVSALALSGLPSRRFCFEGFLPHDKKEREAILKELENESRSIILYEAPHHLIDTLKLLKNTLGEGREMAVCREITKKYETVLRGSISNIEEHFKINPPKGEFVLIIQGKSRKELAKESQEQWQQLSLKEHMQIYLNKNLSKKEAMKMVAKDRGISKRDVYQALL
ncbi:16S rRNA (cytidine1402-2'-O)-methyltransferase [Acetitomaculum ruminis DSM 5522]|uniref:Ribosomal RNA small subunit methyltransferase I n=1 Tax=Acetitomaculum ruminis DSM 5522 TaxID=1120918 RepID=A0A1I0W7C0_9FIRM|nr:16S rRNA (cytidine(1402)-2'-O)-methyltransferase [Acetitomaculum ruminis]SFA84582.1 16S rRNA (cytidine1402-2'-O)-methyltransferase [Acetitomaculum ruminis DSM 5522]